VRILLVNQFYPPDLAPTGLLLRDVAEELARRGHEATVLCSACTYATAREECRVPTGPVQVIRVGKQAGSRGGFGGVLMRQLAFHAAAYRQARRLNPAPEVVVALTSPPLIGLTMQWALRKTSPKHVQWVMDLYPHVLVAHGLLRKCGVANRLLSALTRRQWRRSALIVALSPGMAAKISAELTQVEAPKIVTVPLWAPGHLSPWPEGEPNPLRHRRGWSDKDTVLLYSGNLGLGHTVTPFLELAQASRATPGLRWAFAGDGRRLAEVAAFAKSHPGARIECLPYVDQADLRAHLASADVHLVSLRESWAGLIVPSKLPAAFAVARPVLFVGPANSDPARWIRESGGGWIVSEGDTEGLLLAVDECRVKARRKKSGDAAFRFAEDWFSRSLNCGRMIELIEGVTRSR
jgi:colanic acid biosynthesis glycosyl transferase WcaI